MGELRKTWQAFKNRSLEDFKSAHAKELEKVDLNGVTGYPVKFDKDLGPTLDKFETAKKAKKAGDVTTLKTKTEVIIKAYRVLLEKNKKALGDKAAAAIKTGLDHVEKGLN